MKFLFATCLVALAVATARAETSRRLAPVKPPPPPNDLFSNAVVETGYNWYAYGVTKGAKRQKKEIGKAIWYAWTAPASGPAIVRNWNQTRPYGSFHVFTLTNSSKLKLVKPIKKNRLNFIFNASMGTTYYLTAERARPPKDSSIDFVMELQLTTLVLTQPTNNYKSSDTIPLSIVTTELPSMIASVKYYGETHPRGQGASTLIAESFSPPYSAIWTNPPPGYWSIYAELTRTDEYILTTAKNEIRIRPYNDDFADRRILVGTNINIVDSVAEATLEFDEPTINANMLSGSIWYEWTAPGDGYVYIPHIYGNFAEGLHVFSGSALSTLQFIPTIDHAYNDVPIPVTAGQILQIAVFNLGSIALTHYPIPANDNVASPIELLGTNVAIVGNNRAAASEPNEPVPAQAGGHSVWYAWTAPTNGTLVLQGGFTNGGSSGPLVVTVYTGDDVSNLTTVSTSEFGFFYMVPPPPNTAYIPVLAGTTYRIAVDNSATNWEVGNFGDFNLALSFVPAQPNDAFLDRIELTGNDARFSFTSLGASIEPGEPAVGVSSLWWTWTAPYNGRAMVSGLQYNPAMGYAFTGDSLTNLALVAAKDGYFFWNAEGGKTYQIAISSPWPGPATADLHLHYHTNGTPIEP